MRTVLATLPALLEHQHSQLLQGTIHELQVRMCQHAQIRLGRLINSLRHLVNIFIISSCQVARVYIHWTGMNGIVEWNGGIAESAKSQGDNFVYVLHVCTYMCALFMYLVHMSCKPPFYIKISASSLPKAQLIKVLLHYLATTFTAVT